MTREIPRYALKAYGLLYIKYGSEVEFAQESLNWIVSTPMKKKIFSVLLNSGWIKKIPKRRYKCLEPKDIFHSLFSFKVPDVLKKSEKEYYYSKMSAVEVWSDFSYIQRSWEHSPYFISIKQNDLSYWGRFLPKEGIPFLINEGTFIGEFIILQLKKRLEYSTYNGFPVEKLDETIKFCQENPLFEYPLAYLSQKFNLKVKIRKELMEEVKGVV